MVRLMTPVRVRGTLGSALSFDGEDDYVDCGNDESLDVTTEATLMAWVKLRQSTTYQAIFSKGDDMHENYELLVYSDLSYLHTGWQFDIGRLHHSWYYLIPENEWTFIVLTWKAPLMKLYINGEFKETWDTGANYTVTRTEPLLIGNEYGESRYVNGLIDEVRIYNRALSEEEILQLYKGGMIWNGCVLWLRFDEGSGTTAGDSSGYGNSGTIYGATWTNHGAMILRTPVR